MASSDIANATSPVLDEASPAQAEPTRTPGGMNAVGPEAVGAIKLGNVKLWIEASGTGFISPLDGGPDVYVQRSVLNDGTSLQEGTLVTYEQGWDELEKRPTATLCVGASDATDGASCGANVGDDAGNSSSHGGADHSAGSTGLAAETSPSQQLLMPAEHFMQQHSPQQAPQQPLQQAQEQDNLFVCGLPASCDAETVRAIFQAYGMVVSVKVLPDKGSRPDRAALVRMANMNIAQWLVENLNNNIPMGLTTPVTVRFAQKSTSTTPTGSIMSGTVRVWLEEKGMGFISPSTGGEDFFVHRSNLCDGHSLVPSSIVTFDPAWDVQKNKPVAKKVTGAIGESPGGGDSSAQISPIAVHTPSFVGSGPAGCSSGKGNTTDQFAQPGQESIAKEAAADPAVPGQMFGSVRIWFEEKGFGFISPSDSSGDAFVHRTAIQEGSTLIQGSSVVYIPDWDAVKGRSIARNVRVVAQSTAIPKTGTVKIWFEDKGYGFLAADDGSGDAFVHRSALAKGNSLTPGSPVQYEAHWDAPKGKYIATKAMPAGSDLPSALVSNSMPMAAVAPPMPAVPQQGPDAVIITGLPMNSTEDLLRQVFAPYGTIIGLRLYLDPTNGPTCWLQLGNPVQAAWMASNLNGSIPMGLLSPIWVQFAMPGATPSPMQQPTTMAALTFPAPLQLTATMTGTDARMAPY